MSSSRLQHLAVWSLILCFAGAIVVRAAKPAPSDINGPEKRRGAVELGTKLTKPLAAEPLPAELMSPFSPPGFDQAEPDEVTAARLAQSAGKTVAPKVVTDRDTLEQIATKIVPSGTMIAGTDSSQWRLNFGKSSVKVGTHFTVTLNGQDYDLELASIDRTTFTLRLNREEITRPIKPGKSQ